MKNYFTLLFLVFINLFFCQTQYLDSSFGNNGTVITDAGYNSVDEAYTVAITASQKILVAGKGSDANYINFSLIIRYNNEGSIDTSFGENGKFIIDNLYRQSFISDIKVLSSGKILVLGGAFYNDPNDCLLYITRINENGTLDLTFGSNGYKTLNNSSGKNMPREMFLDNDENIYIINEIKIQSNGNMNKFCIYKLKNNGTTDTTFANNGVTNTFDGSNPTSYIYSTGNILVATSEYPNDSKYLTLYKFSQNGNLDTTFNNGGSRIINYNNLFLDINSILIPSEDKIIITASTIDFSPVKKFVITKLNLDGSFDLNFGNGGQKDFPFANNIDPSSMGIGKKSILTKDNKIIFTGILSAYDLAKYHFIVRKTDLEGNIDNSFGENGQVIIDFGNSSDDFLYNSILQKDGKIICVGETANNFNSSDFAIARLNNSLLSSSETTNYKEKLIINTLVKNYLLFAKKINNLRYQIFDFSGKVIKTGFVYNSKLDLSGLKKGIYLIKVAHETAKFTKE